MTSIDLLRRRALDELSINPTITVYTFGDGAEQRRPANPYLPLHHSFGRVTQAAARMTAFSTALQRAVKGDNE
jgi:hypothetical protein